MAHPSQLKSRIVAILDSRMRRKQMTRFTTAALLTVTVVLTAGLGSIQFTRLAAVPLPAVAPPIPAPVPIAKAPSIAKPAQVPPQEPGYVLNRTPVFYPAGARQKRVEGSVVVELNFSANGQIVDSHVLSGPEELRESAIQTALQGKYAIKTARSLQVIVDFRLPVAGTGEISGGVFTTDVSSVPIPGVIIAATNTASGIITTMVTDQNGAYMFRNLGQGTYRLSARLTGFQDKSFDGVRVGDSQQIQLNFGLRSDADSKRVWSIAASSPISLPDQFNAGPIANISLFGLSQTVSTEMTEKFRAFKGQLISTDLLNRMRTSIKETQGDKPADFTVFSKADGAVDVRIGFPPQGPPVVEFGPADVRVGGNVLAANLVREVKPVYPQAAKDNRIQGVVVLEVKIATDGTVSEARVVTGLPMFVQSALDAVRQWVYKPVFLEGRPVEAVSTITMNFAFEP
jgi:TonB family protein